MSEITFRCNKCILPSTCPTISYDDKGECSFCKKWEEKWGNTDFGDEVEFNRVIERIRDPRNTLYDCVSGLSGGKDSSYAILLGKQKGLRQLAVTFDNGFLSEEGLHNIKAIVNHFGIGHVMVNPGWENLKKLYKHSLMKTGEFCSVCNVGIRAALYRVAKQYKVRSIIVATSSRTESDAPPEFFTSGNDYFTNVFKDFLTKNELKDQLYITYIQKGLQHVSGNLRMVHYPEYIPWKEDQILAELSNQTGWKGALWQQHTDCIMSDAKEYLNLKRNGFIEKVPKLSALIRDGQMTREIALSKIEEEETKIMENETQIQAKMMDVFELTKDEIKQIIVTRHHDYLNKSKNGSVYRLLKQIVMKA